MQTDAILLLYMATKMNNEGLTSRSPYLGDFNIMDILICIICFKIHSNANVLYHIIMWL